jgi:hypothetical protein
MERILATATVVLAVSLTLSLVEARTIWVPDQQSTIENALAAATYGDTVMVRAGTYSTATMEHFPLIMKNGVTLSSEQGPGVTIVDGEGRGQILILVGCDSLTTIKGFAFVNGRSTDQGAAITCRNSSPLIYNNIFRGNHVDADPEGRGGAIACSQGSPVIAENTFQGNKVFVFSMLDAAALGGALYLGDCSATVVFNAFCFDTVEAYSDESASSYGGAVFCRNSVVTLTNNTLYANQSVGEGRAGGGLYIDWGSMVVVENCVFWGNLASTGPQIYPTTVPASYSDISGGWPGIGNISTDPRVVNGPAGTIDLLPDSPCLDTGDPASPLDPDHTRADIGARYFNQAMTPSVELYPQGRPILIASSGGSVVYDAWVYNLADTAITVDIWAKARLPRGSWYGPILNYQNMHINPRARIGLNDISGSVPGSAPAGVYTYVGYVGRFPSTVLDSSYFLFTKSR